MREEKEKRVPEVGSKTGKQNTGSESGVRIRRIAALAGVVLLAGLYVVTFVLAVLGNEKSTQLLRFCFGMTIFVPIFVWVVTWCVGVLFHKKTIASLDLLDSDPEERRKMEEAVARQMEQEEK